MSNYTDAVESSIIGMHGVSTGECPGCEQCADTHDMTCEEHAAAYRYGEITDEGSFSWCGCGICGTQLGGNRYVWHWIRGGDEHGKGGEIEHESDICEDCVMFLYTGDEPENWSVVIKIEVRRNASHTFAVAHVPWIASPIIGALQGHRSEADALRELLARVDEIHHAVVSKLTEATNARL